MRHINDTYQAGAIEITFIDLVARIIALEQSARAI